MSIAQPRRNQYSPTNQPTTKTEKRIGYEEGIHWSRRIFHMSNGVVAWILFDHGRNRVMFQKVVWVSLT